MAYCNRNGICNCKQRVQSDWMANAGQVFSLTGARVQGGHVIHRIKGMFDKVKWGKPQHSQSGRKVRQGIHQRRGYLKQQDRRMELTLLILACHLPWLDLPVSHRHATRANPRYNGVSIQRLTQHRDSAADQEQHQQQERRAGGAGDGSIVLSPNATTTTRTGA
jgi:hypothetical protein